MRREVVFGRSHAVRRGGYRYRAALENSKERPRNERIRYDNIVHQNDAQIAWAPPHHTRKDVKNEFSNPLRQSKQTTTRRIPPFRNNITKHGPSFSP